MLVREYMHTPPVTCGPEATLEQAAREMHLHEVGSVVVVGNDKHPLGVVTDRDLALKAVGWGESPASALREVMTKEVHTVHADVDLIDAARKMAGSGVRRMPVVGDSGAVEGLIALDDVVRALSDEMALLQRTLVTQASGGPGWDET